MILAPLRKLSFVAGRGGSNLRRHLCILCFIQVAKLDKDSFRKRFACLNLHKVVIVYLNTKYEFHGTKVLLAFC